MIASSSRSSRQLRRSLRLAAALSVSALGLVVACSSSDSSSGGGGAAADSGVDGALTNGTGSTGSGADTGTSTGSGTSNDASNGTDDDSAVSDSAANPTGCPDVEGSFLSTAGGGDSSADCPPATSDTCIFTTDTSTCHIVAVCKNSADSFMSTIDSSGSITYTRTEEGITATCTLKFSSDLQSFTGYCGALGIMCDAYGSITD